MKEGLSYQEKQQIQQEAQAQQAQQVQQPQASFPDIRGTRDIPRDYQAQPFQHWAKTVSETWYEPSVNPIDILSQLALRNLWDPKYRAELKAKGKAWQASKTPEEMAQIQRQRTQQAEVALVGASIVAPLALYGIQKYGSSIVHKATKWGTENLPEPILKPYWKAKYWLLEQARVTKEAWKEAFPRLFPEQPEIYPRMPQYGTGYEPKGIPVPRAEVEPSGFTVSVTRGTPTTSMTKTFEALISKGKPLGGLSSQQLLQTEDITRETIPTLPLVEFEPLYPVGVYQGKDFLGLASRGLNFPSVSVGLGLGGLSGLIHPQRLTQKQAQKQMQGQLQTQKQMQEQLQRQVQIQREQQSQMERQAQKQSQKQIQTQMQALSFPNPLRELYRLQNIPRMPDLRGSSLSDAIFGRRGAWFYKRHPVATGSEVASHILGRLPRTRSGKKGAINLSGHVFSGLPKEKRRRK